MLLVKLFGEVEQKIWSPQKHSGLPKLFAAVFYFIFCQVAKWFERPSRHQRLCSWLGILTEKDFAWYQIHIDLLYLQPYFAPQDNISYGFL